MLTGELRIPAAQSRDERREQVRKVTARAESDGHLMRAETLARGGWDKALHAHDLSPLLSAMATAPARGQEEDDEGAPLDFTRTAAIERDRERWIEDRRLKRWSERPN